MDMKRWNIEWWPEDYGFWEIAYFGDGLTVSASYNGEYETQNDILVTFKDRRTIKVQWPWRHDVSPSPIKAMRKLCKLAELHRPKGER